MRILIAIAPRIYREALAYGLGQRDPAPDILLSTPEELEGEVGRFMPHLIVCHEASERAYSSVPARVVILYEDSPNARVCLGPKETMMEDISMEEMNKIVEEVAERVSAETS